MGGLSWATLERAHTSIHIPLARPRGKAPWEL